jgi:hypothetical protein
MKSLPNKWYFTVSKLSREECLIIARYYREKLNSTCYDKIQSDWTYLSSHNDDGEYIVQLNCNTESTRGIRFTFAGKKGDEISFEQFNEFILKPSCSVKNKESAITEDIIGYRAPMDLFNNTIKKGTLYMPSASVNNVTYCAVDSNHNVLDGGKTNLPKEIVELWDPEIKEKFQIGNIVIVTKELKGSNKQIGDIGVIIGMDESGCPYCVDGAWCTNVRMATLEEIEDFKNKEFQQILEEAAKRYPIGTRFIPVHAGRPDYVCIVTNNTFNINQRQDFGIAITSMTDEGDYYASINKSKYGTTSYDRVVYGDGKWAEIVPAYPDITINGYKGEFFPDYVKFGCASIEKEMILSIWNLMSAEVPDGFKKLKKVYIGEGRFDVNEIKIIAEHFLKNDN